MGLVSGHCLNKRLHEVGIMEDLSFRGSYEGEENAYDWGLSEAEIQLLSFWNGAKIAHQSCIDVYRRRTADRVNRT